MREILFRGKRLDNGEWVQGNLDYNLSHKLVFIRTPTEKYANVNMVAPDTVGQYTGLTDRNGVKIFEGDCIKVSDYEEIGAICYGKHRQPCDDCCGGHIGFYVDWVHEVSKELFRKDLGYWADKVEIIGNIHDNPEMLKGGDTDV